MARLEETADGLVLHMTADEARCVDEASSRCMKLHYVDGVSVEECDGIWATALIQIFGFDTHRRMLLGPKARMTRDPLDADRLETV